MKKNLLLPLMMCLIATGGCQTSSPVEDLLQGRKIDYTREEDQQYEALQLPPDLLSTARGVEATVSLSEYYIQSIPTIEPEEVVVDKPAAKVAYRRDGNLRWVTVDLPPEEAWRVTRNFWTSHLGFNLVKEDPEVGTMETDWLDLRDQLPRPGWLNDYLGLFIKRVYESGQRDKFATRIERGEDGSTDIYVAHRHIAAQFDDGIFTGYESQSSDLQLEIEMLRRMMLYIAKREPDEAAAESGAAPDIDAEIAAEEAAATGDYIYEGTELLINKPFAESWQLVQIGLNRGGFSIEDRDYQERIIYIRHSGGPDSDKIFGKAETSFFNRLFGEEKPILREIQLLFTHDGSEQVRLTAEAIEEDEPLTDLQASVVLELLYEYLP